MTSPPHRAQGRAQRARLRPVGPRGEAALASRSGSSPALPSPKPVVTAYTLSLDTPEAMAEGGGSRGRPPLLKLKLGRDGDERALAAIRAAAPKARLIVDANEGWSAAILPRMLAACAEAGVELVEQPLPAAR